MPGRVEVVRRGDGAVGLLDLFGRQTEAPVVDLQDEPAPGPPGTQGDLGVGR